ncbi:TPA: glycine--tRNA ligase [Candidatus Micrarchaeota archaeon]|nr:glycine--tRNA ligase [Candidatus Micrarchaeota archaeon]
MEKTESKIDKIINLCARRGLVFANSEIYSPLGGFFDYAHYGVEVKNRIAAAWWNFFVRGREDMVGLDGSIVSSQKVWQASGHLESFTDPLVECKKCKSRYRADQLVKDELKLEVEGLDEKTLGALIAEHKLKCEKCKGELAEAKKFNLMFKTHVGAVESDANAVFLRPETAQTIFTDFKTIAGFARKKLPFGIAQRGKAFRNEISPRNFLFRAREFEQMEIEYFLHPSKSPAFEKSRLHLKIKVLTAKAQEDKEHKMIEKTLEQLLKEKVISSDWIGYWIGEALFFLEQVGLRGEHLRIRQHVSTELSHYSKETWDFEYDYPEWGWKELVGIADRGDFDLQQHQKHSGKDLSIFDDETKQKVLPCVIEPSFGLDRLFFTLLVDAYHEEKDKTMLKLGRAVAPLDCAVFPLMGKDGLDVKAREVFGMLRNEGFAVEYDESGSIGKRYARMDEVGTPFCITIDYDSLEKGDCTIRFRDSGEQKRVVIKSLAEELKKTLQ